MKVIEQLVKHLRHAMVAKVTFIRVTPKELSTLMGLIRFQENVIDAAKAEPNKSENLEMALGFLEDFLREQG